LCGNIPIQTLSLGSQCVSGFDVNGLNIKNMQNNFAQNLDKQCFLEAVLFDILCPISDPSYIRLKLLFRLPEIPFLTGIRQHANMFDYIRCY
jgi:hypothetical protein